ncbi:hypothetical protein ABIF64_004862 [Bradyrhizobium japonicum]
MLLRIVGASKRRPLLGALAPVEEPSTASIAVLGEAGRNMHFVPKCGFKMEAQLTFDLSRRICEACLSQTRWLAVDRESGDADLSCEILSGSLCGWLSETHIDEAFCLSPRGIFADRCFMILTSKPYMAAISPTPPSSRRRPVRSRPANLLGQNGVPRSSPRSVPGGCGPSREPGHGRGSHQAPPAGTTWVYGSS